VQAFLSLFPARISEALQAQTNGKIERFWRILYDECIRLACLLHEH